MPLREELTVLLTQAHNAFVMAAFALPPHMRTQPGVCGDWSPQQVVAHADAWNTEITARFAAFGAGTASPQHSDTDAFNAQAVAARADLNWDAQLEQLNASYEALLQAAGDLSMGDFARDSRYEEWLRRRAADYHEHSTQFETWTDTALPNT